MKNMSDEQTEALYNAYVDHICDPVFIMKNGPLKDDLESIEVRVELDKDPDKTYVEKVPGDLYPYMIFKVTEKVLNSEKFADLKIPRRRVKLGDVLISPKGRYLDFKYKLEGTGIHNVRLFVFSPTDSSKKVAEMIGDVLKFDLYAGKIVRYPRGGALAHLGRETVDLCDRELFESLDGELPGIRDYRNKFEKWFGPVTDDDTVCVFSVPCYGGRIPQLAAERLAEIKGNGAPAIVCVTFGNRAYEDALLELADIVTENGFKVVAGCAAATEHSIVHEFGRGRPDASDQEQITEFAHKVASKLKEGFEIDPPGLPGNRPYKTWGGSKLPIEVNGSGCEYCPSLCERFCPVGAISENGRKTDRDKCINCMRCVYLCSDGGRYVPKEILNQMAKRLQPVCSKRKKNEFFIHK